MTMDVGYLRKQRKVASLTFFAVDGYFYRDGSYVKQSSFVLMSFVFRFRALRYRLNILSSFNAVSLSFGR